MTFGFIHEDRTGIWPSSEVRGYRHEIARLDTDCRNLIRGALPEATNTGIMQAAIEGADGDQLLPQVLDLLQRYAVDGRFYNLDYLGEVVQPQPSPRALWHEIDIAVFELEIDTLLAGDTDALLAARTHRLQRAVRRWWWLYYQAWAQNVCGKLARRYFSEIAPMGWGL